MQRIGGPTLTTLCALFLSWALQGPVSYLGFNANAWVEAFVVLGLLHAVMAVAAVTLPRGRVG